MCLVITQLQKYISYFQYLSADKTIDLYGVVYGLIMITVHIFASLSQLQYFAQKIERHVAHINFVFYSLPWDADSVSANGLIRRQYEFSTGLLQYYDVVRNVPTRLDKIFGVWDVSNPMNRRSVSYCYREKR
jgi:hypothetical protein